MKQEKAIVVFSGGQDSTTCLFWAMKRFGEVEAVTFNYGQRHSLELECAAQIAKEQNIKHHVLDMSLLSQLAPNALTRSDIEIEAKEGQLPTTFVDGRNLLFLSFAAYWPNKLAPDTSLPESVKPTSAVIRIAGMCLLNR
jgi:7-cyano-7-deazaguanine synthase